jgi:hypothetical protein
MIVTEDEARTKGCQETFAGGTFTHMSERKCVASGCMSWRWFDNLDDEAIKTPRGYCGKAGRP